MLGFIDLLGVTEHNSPHDDARPGEKVTEPADGTGQVISRLQIFGFGATKGSSSRGGARAL